jgi:hypothetical protein
MPTNERNIMNDLTHEDCGFASDGSVGPCEGEVFVPLGPPFSVEPGLPFCERHSALVVPGLGVLRPHR